MKKKKCNNRLFLVRDSVLKGTGQLPAVRVECSQVPRLTSKVGRGTWLARLNVVSEEWADA